jgi:hypothetical protein
MGRGGERDARSTRSFHATNATIRAIGADAVHPGDGAIRGASGGPGLPRPRGGGSGRARGSVRVSRSRPAGWPGAGGGSARAPDRRRGPSLGPRPPRPHGGGGASARHAEWQRHDVCGQPAQDRHPARGVRRGGSRAPAPGRLARRGHPRHDPPLEQRGGHARPRLGWPGPPAGDLTVPGHRAVRRQPVRRPVGRQVVRSRRGVPPRSDRPSLARSNRVPGGALLLPPGGSPPGEPGPDGPDEGRAVAPGHPAQVREGAGGPAGGRALPQVRNVARLPRG